MENAALPNKRISGRLSTALLEWGEEALIALVIIVAVFTFCFRVVTVSGASMSPSYNNGDRLVVFNGAAGLKQGDVVVLNSPGAGSIIKRIIATEGQTVDFDDLHRMVLVDGRPLDESKFGLENGVTLPPYPSFELLDFPQTVPEGCVFVLGDNRAVSEDSRYGVVGMVDRRSILGKVAFRLLPALSA